MAAGLYKEREEEEVEEKRKKERRKKGGREEGEKERKGGRRKERGRRNNNVLGLIPTLHFENQKVRPSFAMFSTKLLDKEQMVSHHPPTPREKTI